MSTVYFLDSDILTLNYGNHNSVAFIQSLRMRKLLHGTNQTKLHIQKEPLHQKAADEQKC